ncbi:hypothetical protein K1T71_007965 [Dendrolimus kikuchii]|uniref:Uncharacterized protein n=1 Tax=Dendrolimus kikuchii TaxID=765133 RepID=A0ACC1CYW5_9NEOP|nr:hypothetical protein K1T71_007965 [Dendrolimus kikuchii]
MDIRVVQHGLKFPEIVRQMSADFHLFLRLMIRCDCEFFRSAFVVLEAICPLTFVEAVVKASTNDIGAELKKKSAQNNGRYSTLSTVQTKTPPIIVPQIACAGLSNTARCQNLAVEYDCS